jgi:hypothetical protein
VMTVIIGIDPHKAPHAASTMRTPVVGADESRGVGISFRLELPEPSAPRVVLGVAFKYPEHHLHQSTILRLDHDPVLINRHDDSALGRQLQVDERVNKPPAKQLFAPSTWMQTI